MCWHTNFWTRGWELLSSWVRKLRQKPCKTHEARRMNTCWCGWKTDSQMSWKAAKWAQILSAPTPNFPVRSELQLMYYASVDSYLIEGALHAAAGVRCHVLQSSAQSTQAVVWSVACSVHQVWVGFLPYCQVKTTQDTTIIETLGSNSTQSTAGSHVDMVNEEQVWGLCVGLEEWPRCSMQLEETPGQTQNMLEGLHISPG